VSRLLLIEDEDVIRRALRRFLERRGIEVHEAATIEAARRLGTVVLHGVDVVLADLRLPDEPGTAIIADVAPCPVVVMTSHASVRSAVEVMKAGASDYIAKPFDHDELLLVLERAMQRDRLGTRAAALERDLDRLLPPSLRVQGTSLEALADRLHLQGGVPDGPTNGSGGTAARHWLWGETGSGREAVARALHARSDRAGGPLVVADPASDPGGERNPSLRAARGGTLVLRHLHRLSPDARDALVQRLATRTGAHTALIVIAEAPPGVPPGAHGDTDDDPIATDITGLFASEVHARIPPLDERRGDIVMHARHVLDAIRVRTGREPSRLSAAACDWLSARAWPGQVLELEQLVARAALLAAGTRIEREHLTGLDTVFDTAPDLEGYFRWFVLDHESRLSETELAQRLGISRKALWERRQRMGLPRAGG